MPSVHDRARVIDDAAGTFDETVHIGVNSILDRIDR
jgi:hypothetical protein